MAWYFSAFDKKSELLLQKAYYSVGGGFVVDETAEESDCLIEDSHEIAYPFDTAQQLLELCEEHNLSISQLMLENEKAWHSEEQVREKLLNLWSVMQASVANGIANDGILPGGLKVPRRAGELHKQLLNRQEEEKADPLLALDWVTLFALAVNEENAAGGRIVTAPTNGAAGIIPAVFSTICVLCPMPITKG